MTNTLIKKDSFSEMFKEYLNNEGVSSIKHAEQFLKTYNEGFEYDVDNNSFEIDEEFESLPDVPIDVLELFPLIKPTESIIVEENNQIEELN